MGCIGDGWHMVGSNCKVLVENRVIVKCLTKDKNSDWIPCYIKRWNKEFHWYQRTGLVTLAAFRSGLGRGTMTYGQ